MTYYNHFIVASFILILVGRVMPLIGQPAQPLERFRVVDLSTGVGIPFAHLAVSQSDQGAASDIDGYFNLEGLEIDLIDSISLHAIGYRAKSVMYRDLSLITKLETQAYDLPEIKISGDYTTIKIGGLQPRKAVRDKGALALVKSGTGTEIGTVINHMSTDRYVEALNFYLKKNRCDSILFRIRLYDISRDTGLESLINHRDITFSIGEQKKWIHVPLDQYGIMTNSTTMLVSIEALASWGNESDRSDFSLAYDKRLGCCAKLRQYSRKGGWLSYALKGGGLAFNLEVVSY